MTFCQNLDDAETFVRLVRPELGAERLHRPEQGREHFTFLSETEAIPALIDYQRDNHVISCERMAGAPLLTESLTLLSQDQQKHIGNRIGAKIGDLHLLGPQPSPEPSQLPEHSLSRIYAKMANPDSHDLLRMRDVQSYLEQGHTQPQAIIHNDLGPGNILYDPERDQIGFIDFSNVRSDNAHVEFVTLLKNYGNEFTQHILDGYAARTGRTFTIPFIQTTLDTSCMIHLPSEDFKLPPAGRW